MQLTLLSLLALHLIQNTLAFRLEFESRKTGSAASTSSGFASKASDDDPFDFQNVNSILGADIYVASLSIDGKTFDVQLDTGSSDLWLDTTKVQFSSNVKSTGISSTITYGDGTVATGPVLIGNVTFGDFSISQAFISAPGTNATTNNDTGLLGVGPPLLSEIAQDLSKSQFNGASLLTNLFAQNTSEPDFITFQLSRSQSTGATDGGVFTIGEIESNFSAISSAPKLEVISKDRWIVFLDGITVNGQNVSGHSSFNENGQGSGQTLANLDSGTSLALIPQFYLDAIYGSIPGAQFDQADGVYTVPCDANIELSFIFGGISYPVHPIDTVIATETSRGSIICYSGFPAGDGDTEDFLLGDSFLRNVYSSYDFGSFVSGTDSPFIQLLSTTDASQASSEFTSLSAQRNSSITNGGSTSVSPTSGSGGSGGSSPSPSTTNSPHNSAASSINFLPWSSFAILAVVSLLSGQILL